MYPREACSKNLSLLATRLVVLAAVLLLAVPAAAENPFSRADRSWITIDGTIGSVSADAFILDYGGGEILVEMDDGDRDADGYKLLPGDKVTVTGRIDDDLFEKTSIEAASVHVKKLGTTFFASAADEEDFLVVVTTPDHTAATVLYGPVTAVGKGEFTLDRGKKSLTVDVGLMAENPLDDEGYLKIEVGDYVRVTGTMEKGFFGERKLVAASVTELFD